MLPLIVLACFPDDLPYQDLRHAGEAIGLVRCLRRRNLAYPYALRARPAAVLVPVHDSTGLTTDPLIQRLVAVAVVVGVCQPPDLPSQGFARAIRAGGYPVAWSHPADLRVAIQDLVRSGSPLSTQRI